MEYSQPADLFRVMATRLFRRPLAEVSAEMRAAVKAVTYAQLYGSGVRRIAEEHELPEEDVRRTVTEWRRSYPKVQPHRLQPFLEASHWTLTLAACSLWTMYTGTELP